MKAALEKLGLPTYHGFEYVDRPYDQRQWMKAVEAKWYGKGKPFGRAEFDDFLGDWAALSDLPLVAFAEEIIEAYPEVGIPQVLRPTAEKL